MSIVTDILRNFLNYCKSKHQVTDEQLEEYEDYLRFHHPDLFTNDSKKVPEKVYKPRDIIDGKFLEDYFYNS